MSYPYRDYDEDIRGKCKNCCLHCFSTNDLQRKLSKLLEEIKTLNKEKEIWLENQRRSEIKIATLKNDKRKLLESQQRCNEEIKTLKNENEKWLADQRRYIIKIVEDSEEINILRTKLKEDSKEINILKTKLKDDSVEINTLRTKSKEDSKEIFSLRTKLNEAMESKRCLMSKINTSTWDIKSNVMSCFEGSSQKGGGDSNEKNHVERVNADEVKDLQEKLKTVIEEKNILLKKLESKSESIRHFLRFQENRIYQADMKTNRKLLKKFHLVLNEMSVCSTENLSVMQMLQEVQSECNNCRATFLHEKSEYENQVKSLEHELTNKKFIIQQQEGLILELKEEIKKLKESPKKEKVCSQEEQKMCKEKGDILLPPTPDSWTATQDMPTLCEDISFDIHQSHAVHDQCQVLSDSLEIAMKSEHQEYISNIGNKQNEPPKKTLTSDKDSNNGINVVTHETIHNPVMKPISEIVTGKEKGSLGSACHNFNTNKCYSNSRIQEVSSDKADENKEIFNVFADESKECQNKNSSYTQHSTSGKPSHKNSLVLLGDESSTVFDHSSVSNVNRIAMNIDSNSDYLNDSYVELDKSVGKHGLKQNVDIAHEININCHPFTIDNDQTVIGSEGWSPEHDLEPNDFESTLVYFTRIPPIISPFTAKHSMSSDGDNFLMANSSRQPLVEDARHCNHGDFDCNVETPKQPRSIFSPIPNSSDQDRIKSEGEERTKMLIDTGDGPDDMSDKGRSQGYEIANESMSKSDKFENREKKVNAVTDSNEFETKSMQLKMISQNNGTLVESPFDMNSETRVCTISNLDKKPDDKEKEKNTGLIEDGIFPLKINSEKSFKEIIKQECKITNLAKTKLEYNMKNEIRYEKSQINKIKCEDQPLNLECKSTTNWTKTKLKYNMKNEIKFEESEIKQIKCEDQPLNLCMKENRDVHKALFSIPLDLEFSPSNVRAFKGTGEGELPKSFRNAGTPSPHFGQRLCTETGKGCDTNQILSDRKVRTKQKGSKDIKGKGEGELPKTFSSLEIPAPNFSQKLSTETRKDCNNKIQSTRKKVQTKQNRKKDVKRKGEKELPKTFSNLGTPSPHFDQRIPTETSEDCDNQIQSHEEVQTKPKARVLKDLSGSYSPDTSMVTPRSPKALDRYDLRLSPKAQKNFQYIDISPAKDGSHSKASPKDISNNTSLSECIEMSPMLLQNGKSIDCSNNNNEVSSPRSPESMKHYNMRLDVSQRNYYSSSRALKNKSKCSRRFPDKVSPSSVGHKPLTFKQTPVLPNAARSYVEILSEIKDQSTKDDSVPLELKLLLTPQERLNKLKQQKSCIIKPIEINVDSTTSKSVFELENNKMVALNTKNSQSHIEKHHISDSETIETVCLEKNNPSRDILESENKPQASRKVLRPLRTYSKLGNFSSNDLLKIADCTINEEANNHIKRLSQKINYCQQLCERLPTISTSSIDVTSVSKTETTLSKETLFSEYDMAFKCVSYKNTLFDGKQKNVNNGTAEEESPKKKQRMLDFLDEINKDCPTEIITRLHENSITKNKEPYLLVTTPMTNQDQDDQESCSLLTCSSNDNSKSEKEDKEADLTETTPMVDQESCSLSSFSSGNNSKSDEEASCLVIDIDDDEMWMDSLEAALDKPNVEQSCSVTNSTNESCLEGINLSSDQMKSQSNSRLVTDKGLGLKDFQMKEIRTSDPQVVSCFVPQFQPLPEAMCKYSEYLSKTNTDFTLPENRILPFLGKSDETVEQKDLILSNNTFVPNFYTELNGSVNVKQQQIPEESTEDDNGKTFNPRLSNKIVLKMKTLDELIPKGEKTKVFENVLRTVINKYKEDFDLFQERNILEKRTSENDVAGDRTMMVLEIINPLLSEDFKSELDLCPIVDILEQYEIRVIVKALMMLFYKLGLEAQGKSPQNLWMFGPDVPQIPNKKSPFIHPKIQLAFLLLYQLITRHTSEMGEEDKRKFVDEELSYLRFIFVGGSTEFTDSLQVFWMNLGFLYTLLARQFGFKYRVRELIYDMIYCFTRRALTVAYAILKTWPSVLLAGPNDFLSNNPLAQAIILNLTKTPRGIGTMYYINSLHDLLRQKYKYNADSFTRDQVFDLCYQRLELHGVQEAVVLLVKRQYDDWFQKRPLQLLVKVVEDWWKGGDECSDVRAVAAIKTICLSLRGLPTTQIQPQIQSVLNLLQDILSDENTPEWMQEVIVVNTCCLARHNLNMCLDVIANWRPSEISQSVVDQIVSSIIFKRPKKWWQLSVGKSYLRPR